MQLLTNELIGYAVGQLEIEAQTNRVQLKLYMQFTSQRHLLWLYENIDEYINWEPAKGSAVLYRKECTMDETRIAGPWEVGEMKVQGKASKPGTAGNLVKGEAPLVGAAHGVSPVPMRHGRRSANCRQHPQPSVTQRIFGSERSNTVGDSRFANERTTAFWRTPSERPWDGFGRQCLAEQRDSPIYSSERCYEPAQDDPNWQSRLSEFDKFMLSDFMEVNFE